MPYLIAFLIAAIVALSVIVVILWRQTHRVALGLDEIAEDTLKALYHLSREKPIVRASDLIAVIGLVYITEIWLSKPAWGEIGRGLLIPSIPIGATLMAVGIIGATVMPHNLYLHSALIQTRVRPSDSL